MKKSVAVFVILCAGIAGAVVYLNHQKTTPVSAPVAETASNQMPEQVSSERIIVPKSTRQSAENTGEPSQMSAAIPAADKTKSDDSTNSISKAVDALLSAKSAGQKHALFEQLRKSGQLNAVIAELQQRMAQNPNNPQIPTTLGEAQLNKLRAFSESGGDYNEIGILAMQADQSFNAALKIDPSNYEAQLVKAISMTYWPADPTRDGQVVQTLSDLIDRQETMTAQPGFAQTYLYLGNEYQKIGQPEKAVATWQLGLAKFPNDSALQKKISGQ